MKRKIVHVIRVYYERILFIHLPESTNLKLKGGRSLPVIFHEIQTRKS